MINCKRATMLLSESQERELSFKERSALTLHTTMCKGCRNFSKQMGTIRSLCREYAKGEGESSAKGSSKESKE